MGSAPLIRFHLEAVNPSTNLPYPSFDHPVRLIVDLRQQVAQLIASGQLPNLTYTYWLAYRDEINPDVWHEAPSRRHQADGLLSAELTHFSEWAAGVRPDRWTPKWHMPTVAEFSGAAAYSHPLELPPGRAGLQPDLTLSYNSRGLDGLIHNPEPGTIADGWSLAQISIIRVGVRTDYCPYNNNLLCQIHPNQYRLVLNGSGHELVTFDPNQATSAAVLFHARNAPHLRITRYYNEAAANTDKLFWAVETPDGRRYRLGYTADAEEWQTNPYYLEIEGHPGYANEYDLSAIAWHVDTVTDSHGNQMQFSYNHKNINEELGNLNLTTRKNRLVAITYNYPDRITSLPAAPTVARLSSTPGSRIALHAPGDNVAGSETNPITRILIFHGTGTAPVKEYRLTSAYHFANSPGCLVNNTPWVTTTRKLTAIRLFINTDNNPHSDAETNVHALPEISFAHDDQPHFHKNGQPCFVFPYLSQVNNGYGGNVSFAYGTDNRIVGDFVISHTITYPDIGYTYFVTRTLVSDGINQQATHYQYKTPCYAQNSGNVGAQGVVCPAYQGEYRSDYAPILGFDLITTTVKGYAGENLTRRVADYDISDDDTLGMNQAATLSMWDSSSQSFKQVQQTVHALAHLFAPARFAYVSSTAQYSYQPGSSTVFMASRVQNYYETDKQGGGENQFFGHLTRQTYQYWQGTGWLDNHHLTYRYRTRTHNDYWLLLPWRHDLYDSSWNRQQLSLTYYDGATNNPDSSTLSQGRVTLSRAVLLNDPLGNNQWPTLDTQFTYDNYGNPKKIISNPAYGQVGHNGTIWNYSVLPSTSSRQETEISYETGYNLYPITVTQKGDPNSSGDDLVTHFQVYGFNGAALDGWQKQTGLLKQVTNPNGTLVIYEYDPFGRLFAAYENENDRGNIEQVLDGDPLVRYRYWDNGWNQAQWVGGELKPIVYLNPAENDPFMITTQTRPGSFNLTTPGYEFRQRTFFDGLGRPMQSHNSYQEVHEGGSLSQKDIISTTRYNGQGLADCQTVPYTAPLYNSFPANPYLPHSCPNYSHIATTYDTLGRPLTVTSPGGTTATYAYAITSGVTAGNHDRLAVTRIQDGNDHLVRHYHNVWGQLALVREYTGSYPNETAYADTRYFYNTPGQLTHVGTSDPSNTPVSTWLRLNEITYDAVGRKLSLNDPDMGQWSYGYDALSNLAWQTDALGQRLCFTYDPFNRPTHKRHDANNNGCASNDLLLAQTSYYAAGSGGGTGQVQEIKWPDNANKENFSYDSKGRLTSHSRTIVGISYTMGYGNYDKLNRPTTLTYPSNETVTIGYDHEGENSLAAGSDTLVSNVTYNQRGQMVSLVRSSFTSSYSYYNGSGNSGTGNNNFRLSSIQHGALYDSLPNFSYSYDKAGNILGQTIQLTSGVSDSQSYTYDALNRLKTASGSGSISGVASYNHTYNYDKLGNLTSLGSGSYDYSSWHTNLVCTPSQPFPSRAG